MRKRILIGLAMVAFVGLGGYVLSQPRNGTVEYHKAKYVAENNPTKFESLISATWVPDSVKVFFWKRREQRATFHQRALFEAGYLREVTFAVSNDRPLAVVHAIRRRSPPAFPKDVWNFVVIKRAEANVLTLVVPGDAMAEIGGAVRDADMDLRTKGVNYE